MRTNKLYLLIGLLVFLVANAFGSPDEDDVYKILKIRSKGDYYIIGAKRNDSLFKIISKKVSLDKKPTIEKLRKGKRYWLYFDWDNDTTKYGPALAGNASYLHVQNSRFFTDAKIRRKSMKRFHNRVYVASNLIGLYYTRWPVSGVNLNRENL